MSPSKESVLETPKKEHSHRITVSSAKRARVEAEEQVADDIVQADRLPEVGAVVVASSVAGGVGGMPSKPLPYGWYSEGVGKKTLKKVPAATGKKGVDAKTVGTRERWMLRYCSK